MGTGRDPKLMSQHWTRPAWLSFKITPGSFCCTGCRFQIEIQSLLVHVAKIQCRLRSLVLGQGLTQCAFRGGTEAKGHLLSLCSLFPKIRNLMFWGGLPCSHLKISYLISFVTKNVCGKPLQPVRQIKKYAGVSGKFGYKDRPLPHSFPPAWNIIRMVIVAAIFSTNEAKLSMLRKDGKKPEILYIYLICVLTLFFILPDTQ